MRQQFNVHIINCIILLISAVPETKQYYMHIRFNPFFFRRVINNNHHDTFHLFNYKTEVMLCDGV